MDLRAVAQLVLMPFLAAGVWMLLDGLQSVAAWVARSALVLWLVFFSAFDAVAGIATGVLTRHANTSPATNRKASSPQSTSSGPRACSQTAGSESSETWVTCPGSSSPSPRRSRLYRARARRVVVAATFLSVLFASHSGLGAAVGLVALFVAELHLQEAEPATAPSRR